VAMRDLLNVKVDGEIDQTTLTSLQESLDLKKAGRLTDDWDQAFGYRYPRGGTDRSVSIDLYRDPWQVSFAYDESTPRPTEEEIAQWKEEIVAGIQAAGLTPKVVYPSAGASSS
jgi:hypothetical protein